MDKKILILSVAGLAMGMSFGLLFGIGIFQSYITSYTEECTQQFDICREQLNRCDPLFKYDDQFNLSMEGFEYEPI